MNEEQEGFDPLELLTVQEVAGLMHVSRPTVEKHVEAGKLSSVVIGRCRRIRRVDLEAFLDCRTESGWRPYGGQEPDGGDMFPDRGDMEGDDIPFDAGEAESLRSDEVTRRESQDTGITRLDKSRFRGMIFGAPITARGSGGVPVGMSLLGHDRGQVRSRSLAPASGPLAGWRATPAELPQCRTGVSWTGALQEKERIMRSARVLWVLLIVVVACWSGVPVAADAIPMVSIPLLINKYPNSNATDQQIKDSVKEANKLLKQAGLQLVQVKPTNTSPQGDNGDGDFTSSERGAARTYGGQELKGLPNEKGIKISIGRTPMSESPTATGVSLAGAGIAGDPTMILQYKNSAAYTGNTIAHELGHIMGIDGDYNNPNRVMDARGRGSTFSAAEIADMQRQRYTFGKCSTQWDRAYPAQKDKQQYGATTDNGGDATSGLAHHDLHRVVMVGMDPSDPTGGDTVNLSAHVTLGGLFPQDEDVFAEYTLGFNTDDNPTTGVPHGGYTGVDRIVTVRVTGRLSAGPLLVEGDVLDTVSSVSSPLPEMPTLSVMDEVGDFEVGRQPAAAAIDLLVPKDLLNLAVPEVDVVVTAGDGGSVYDTTEDLFFDRVRWQDDPTLTTFGDGTGRPGHPYQIHIDGLAPDSFFDVHLDDTLVLTGQQLDSTGSFAGDVTWPAEASEFEPHFLVAQDDTGEFAYNATCPMSLPGDFNGNGTHDAEDIDLLYAESASGSPDPSYDLSGDGLVDQADVDVLIRDLMGTEYGDANLDRAVDGADLSLMGAKWLQSGYGWGDGNFSGDAAVDGADLSLMGAKWLWEAPVGAMPEPATLTLLTIGGLALLRRRRK